MSNHEPEPTAEQVVFDALASVGMGMGVEQVVAALRKAQMLNDDPWEEILTTTPLSDEVASWETEVIHSDDGPPRIVAYFQSDSYGKVVSYMTPDQWKNYIVNRGHGTLSYQRPLIVKEN